MYLLWVDVNYMYLISASSKNKGYICYILNFYGFGIFKLYQLHLCSSPLDGYICNFVLQY